MAESINPEMCVIISRNKFTFEELESVQDRINFGRSMSKEHHLKVIPYLLPNHSHEFYEAV